MNQLIPQATQTLRATGGRMTAQRRLILQTLTDLGGHPSAEEIYAAARSRDPSLNPSTVYRTLGWLEEVGLVSHRHLDAGQRRERCERFDPASPVEHHHFVCERCGRVDEFDAVEIAQVKVDFARQHGALVEAASLTLYGLCADCLRTSG